MWGLRGLPSESLTLTQTQTQTLSLTLMGVGTVRLTERVFQDLRQLAPPERRVQLPWKTREEKRGSVEEVNVMRVGDFDTV